MTDLDPRIAALREAVKTASTTVVIDGHVQYVSWAALAVIDEQAAEIERLKLCVAGWIKQNGPGGWIDNLRTRVADLERDSMEIPDSDVGWDDDRVDVVGQNGNDGLHYREAEAGPTPLRGRITDRSRD